MFPTRIEFYIEERVNNFRPNGKEWALDVVFDGASRYTIVTFDHKPSEAEVKRKKLVAVRCFDVFVRELKIPDYAPEISYCEDKQAK